MSVDKILDYQKETIKHMKNVKKYMKIMMNDLIDRIFEHDKSKIFEPEIKDFIKYTHMLKGLTYGSDEYKECMGKMKTALDHHYKNNRHHPEWFENGISGMNLVDLIELIADWKAASLRHDNGNILKSIDINTERFNISDQLKQILINTVKDYFEE